MVAMLEGMGADAIGVNCSLGPKALAPVVKEYLSLASVPVLLKPNAGLPRVERGKTVFDVAPKEFAADVAALIGCGVRAAGGCCGTTPAHIAQLVCASSAIEPLPIQKKSITCVSSYTHAVTFGDSPILIGERINPTGKRRFKEALAARDMDYILKEGIAEEEAGAEILDVNVGLPGIDEASMLTDAISELQAILDLPLQIDTSDPLAMERALRRYNGKAMINSVNGKRESMDAVFPLAKKYGGLIVALTLDEDGIPPSAEGRLAIAKRILAEAERWGIDQKDLIFDPLAMAVSADSTAARETLRAVSLIRRELGCHTSLGVSNVSFGLPSRELINGTFFAMALEAGLSAAIMNPHSDEMMKTYYAYRALKGLDGMCADFISYAERRPQAAAAAPAPVAPSPLSEGQSSPLRHAIVKGLKDRAAALTAELLRTVPALSIVEDEIIPALNTVGEGYEKKTVYLPGLLMSAEAAKAAFEEIRASMKGSGATDRYAIVIATVKGDIHDIGKNIVKLLLENYGFAVTDLGRDVPPERIVSEAVRLHAPLVGLSALMTTTVPEMEKTIRLLRAEAPFCKVIVGGAVLTRDYAAAIGADRYARDAMEAVRYAEELERAMGSHGDTPTL
jgi:5-methyltetrahydrofolate--homocysteine methyltransferase